MQNSEYGAKLRDYAISLQTDCLNKLSKLDFIQVLDSGKFKMDPTKVTFKIEGVNGNFVRQELRNKH